MRPIKNYSCDNIYVVSQWGVAIADFTSIKIAKKYIKKECDITSEGGPIGFNHEFIEATITTWKSGKSFSSDNSKDYEYNKTINEWC